MLGKKWQFLLLLTGGVVTGICASDEYKGSNQWKTDTAVLGMRICLDGGWSVDRLKEEFQAQCDTDIADTINSPLFPWPRACELEDFKTWLKLAGELRGDVQRQLEK